MIAARQIFLGRGGTKVPTAADYVQTGLVAMWDGIENAGWGVHDSNATVWKDLVGGYDFAIPSYGASFADDCVTLKSSSLSTSLQEVARPDFTIECVASAVGVTGAFVWLRNPSWAGGALIGWQSSGRCYYPWTNIGNLGDRNLQSVSLSWTPTEQTLMRDGTTIAHTTGSLDPRNVLSQVYIGEYNGGYASGIESYCVRLYSRALTAAEIAANYAVDKARFNLP